MVGPRRWKTVMVRMALTQEHGGTPKIDVASKQQHRPCAHDGRRTDLPRRAWPFAHLSIQNMVGPRRWKTATVSSRRKWAHTRGNGGTRREFLVFFRWSSCASQKLSTRCPFGRRKLITMPTFLRRKLLTMPKFLAHAGDSHARAQ